MANGNHAHRIEQWLGLKVPTNASPCVKRQAKIARIAIDLLKKSAPGIANLQPGATWSDEQQAELQSALLEITEGNDQRDVHNAIAYVITRGNEAGIWKHQPWPLRAVVQLAPSKVTRSDIEGIRATAHRREHLLDVLPRILNSGDEHLLTAALIVSAVDFSGVLQWNLLEQLLDRKLTFHVKSGLAWVNFRLGSIKKPWRNGRRWLLDPVSLQLARKLIEQRQSNAIFQMNLKQAMIMIASILAIPSNELTTTALINSSRAWWATQLPTYLHDYALRPVVALSLPPTAWTRLLSGKPLTKGAAPLPVRQLARAVKEALDGRQLDVGPADHVNALEKQTDFFTQRAALKALMKSLRQTDQEKKLNASRLDQRLKAWSAEHAHIEGWVGIFDKWVRSTLFDRKAGAFERGSGPRAPGILRYLGGFSLRFIQHFWNFTIDSAEDSEDDWFRRMELFRRDIAPLSSASVAKAGLCNFLRFAEQQGAPRTELGEDWRVVASPSEADANLLTPVEYVRLKSWLTNHYQGVENSYPALRAQVMLALAFRLGTRWEELRNLRLQDCVLSEGSERYGSIWIRKTDFSHGKTSSFQRTLSIEHFLSLEERRLLASFFAMAQQLGDGPRPGSDLLFADPGCLSLPPLETNTHDLIQRGMREVSGDASLVFHHLRHSAASFMFLRVMCDETRGADPFPWLCGWEHVSSIVLIGEGRNYAATLSGRSAHNASRLYLVSEMLGHLDPESSVRSYIHFADVVLHTYVTSLVSLPTALLATLEGVKSQSILKRVKRAKKQSRAGQRESE